jgi:hypothetical protein
MPSEKDPFGAFVAQASHEPVAHAALADAYASFDRKAREELVDAAVNAARAERVPVAPLLAAFLSVEPIGEVAERIALYAEATSALSPETEAFGVLTSEGAQGRAVLVRPLYGPFSQLLALEWDERGPTGVAIDDLVDRAAVDRRAGERKRVPYEVARAAVVEMLWRAHRSGSELGKNAALARFL